MNRNILKGSIIKSIAYVSLPLGFLLYLFYKVKMGIDIHLEIFSFMIIITFLISMDMRHRVAKEQIQDFEQLKTALSEKRWMIVEEGENTLLLKPKFGFPFRGNARLGIQYLEPDATIEGPWIYVESLLKEINGKNSRFVHTNTRIISFVIIFVLLTLPILDNKGLFFGIRVAYHNLTHKNAQVVEISDLASIGNTVGNINNYGQAVENENHIFYMDGMLRLIKADKSFNNETCLIERDGGHGIDFLNIAGDWIYYRSGETIGRIRTDGSDNQTIYRMGYLLSLCIKGDKIYFINYADKSNIYRMDLNGQNLERFLNVRAVRLAIYGDRLFYSHDKDGSKDGWGYIESVDFDGGQRRIELDVKADMLTQWEGSYFYIGQDGRLFKQMPGEPGPAKVLIDDEVATYLITDAGIFYSLQSDEAWYTGVGLYKINTDGSGFEIISTGQTQRIAHVGGWLIYSSSDGKFAPTIKKYCL